MKILSLNLNYYGEKHGTWPKRRSLITEVIKETDPDMIAFQAVCSDLSIENGKDQALQIKEELPHYIYSVFTSASGNSKGRQEGNAVLSKFPIVESNSFLLSLPSNAEDKTQRLILRVGIRWNDEPFYLYNAHFSWVKEQTMTNVHESLPYLKLYNDNSLLVGDFNSDPKDNEFKPFYEAGWADIYQLLYPKEEGFTFESDKLFTRIDYAWANERLIPQIENFQILKKENGNIRLSDHLGILITIGT